MSKPSKTEQCARYAHEASRQWNRRPSLRGTPEWKDTPAWEDLDEETRKLAVKNASRAIRGDRGKDAHDAWVAAKVADGWVYGPVKDEATKVHPRIRPWDDLSEAEQGGNILFVEMVRKYAQRFLDQGFNLAEPKRKHERVVGI